VIFFIPLGIYKYGQVWSNGRDGDYLVIGNICYSCVILTVNAKALLCLDSWNKFTNLAIFGSVFIWFLFLVVYSYFWPTLPLAANMAGIIQLIATTPMFWFSLLLVPMASLLPDICAKVGTITIKPSETDLVKLAEKGNYSPAPFIDKTMGRLGKIRKDAKFFMTNKRQKSKSGSVSEDPNLEMQTGEPTERGYAFSQEEHGAVSQKDLVRAYSRTDTRRVKEIGKVVVPEKFS
jgi:phospholipid-transporting ATPase